MITVVLTTFNSQKYILEQLTSILEQTRTPDEVIICDDASDDQTPVIVQKFIKKRNLESWKFIINKENVGFIKNFRKALALASGDIVFLSDHDDVWLPNKIEIMAKCIQLHPEILILNSSFLKIDANGNQLPIKQIHGRSNNNLIHQSVKKTLTKIDFKSVAVYNTSPGCTCAMRKILVDRYLKLESGLPHDWELNIIASLQDGLYYLNVPTIKYRIYSGNEIGLGHVSDYSRRLKISRKNCHEKVEILKIASSVAKDNISALRSARQLVEIFSLRVQLLESKKIFKYLTRILALSIGRFPIASTLALDVVTIIRN